MDEHDFLYIAQKLGMVVSLPIKDRELFVINSDILVEDLIVFAETLLYEWEEHKAVEQLLHQYEIGEYDPTDL